MNVPMRLELSGRVAERFEKAFSQFVDLLEGVTSDIDEEGGSSHSPALDALTELISTSHGWVKAKLKQPVIENERQIAEIAARFEEIKRIQAETQRIAVETARDKVQLKRDKLALAKEGMVTAMEVLDFCSKRVVRGEDGRMYFLVATP